MEFHQLRYFIAAAEELGITRAARRLNVTQPALSRQIAALEEELGVALFDRIKQRIYLTDAGRFFLTRARQIVCDAATSAQQVREQFGSARRTLRLGFLTPFLDDLVVPAVKAFRQRHPTTQVALFELSPRAQLDRLRNDELDLAVLGNVATDDHAVFEVHAIMRSRMAAILPVDHALSARRSIALRELAGRCSFPFRICFSRVDAISSGPSVPAKASNQTLAPSATPCLFCWGPSLRAKALPSCRDTARSYPMEAAFM
ncbi:MAG: LysR family transcriptional regulator [Verrucomicrobiales bacterium]